MKKTKILISTLCLIILFSCLATVLPNRVYAGWQDKTGEDLNEVAGTLWIYMWNWTDVDEGERTELGAYILEPTGSTSDAYTYTFKLSDMPRYDATKYNLIEDFETFQGLKGATGYNYTSFVANADTYEVTAPMDAAPLVAFHFTTSEVTVTFNANGGSAVEDQTVTLGEKATEPSTSRTGYTLEGWYNGDTKFDFNTAVNSDLTLTAHWTPTNYTIGYTLNGGSATNPASYTIETDTFTLNNPTRTGYEFKGWSGTDLTGNTNTSVSIAKGSTGNRTYTANWTPITYSISYTLNGGSATNNTTYTIETDTFTLNEPTRTGYEFKGWSGTDLTGDTNKPVSIAKGSMGNKSYTANWYKLVPNPNITILDTEIIYTGSAIKPAIRVKDNDGDTIPSSAYTVSYSNNTNAGIATLTVKNNFLGGYYKITQKTIPFEIQKQEVSLEPGNTGSAYIKVLGLPVVYNSDHHEVAINVYDNNGKLIPSTEYTVSYSNNRDAGTATVIVTNANGGNYVVNGSENFEIEKLVTNVEITLADTTNCIYSGEAHTPAVTKVKAGNSTLATDEYTVVYKNNINAGMATVKVQSENPSIEYSGDALFEIKPKDVEVTVDDKTKVYGDDDPEFTYAVDGLIGNDTLEGLVISRVSGEDAGEYTITVTHDDTKDTNYNVVIVEGTLKITPQVVTVSGDWSGDVPSIILSANTFEYDGKQKEPTVTVKDNNGNVIPSEEYDVEYANNKKAGTATVTVIDKENGNYIVSGSKEFEIEPHIIEVDFTISGDTEYEYIGKEIKPEVIKVIAGSNEIVASEYEVVYENNVLVGVATVSLKSKDNHPNVIFDGSKTFTIIKKQATVIPNSGEKIYGDEDPELTYSVTGLISGDTLSNIILTRASGEDAGTYEITGTASGDAHPCYEVSFASGDFTILPRPITVKAKDVESHYLETPAYEYIVTSGEILSGDTLDLTYSLSDTEETGGKYKIIVSQSGDANPNYDITFDNTGLCQMLVRVTLDLNGGAFSGDKETSYLVKKYDTFKKIDEEPALDEWYFLAWYTDPTLNNILDNMMSGDLGFDFSTELTEDITLTAEWFRHVIIDTLWGEGAIAIDTSEDKLDYYFSGDTEKPISYAIYPIVKGFDNPLVIGAIADDYYHFVRWIVKSSGDDEIGDIDEYIATAEEFSTDAVYSHVYTEPMYLYAYFEGNPYTITFETNGGNEIEPLTIKNGEGYLMPDDPTRGGYRFAGWYTDPECKTQFQMKFESCDDITLYAKWNKKSSGSGSSKVEKTEPKEEQKEETTIWSDASDWAIPELKEAQTKNIIPSSFAKKDFTKPITRKEFAAVAVKLYEAITNTKVEPVKENPFEDTDDEYVLKAYAVGITNGTSENEFSPDMLITREQMATMITRGLRKAGIDVSVKIDSSKLFVDDSEMHDWGKDAVYFMAGKDIIKGVGENRFDALGDATIEQSLAISLRSLNVFVK